MNKPIIASMFFLSLLASCTKNHDENCDPETVSSEWTSGKEISVIYNAEFERNDYIIADGNQRLFEYNHSGSQCDDIYDDEWGEILSFIINVDVDDFEFEDQEILETNCFYQEYGAWVRHNQYQVKDGVISGEKISEDKWEISVSITTTPIFEDEQTKSIQFTEVFTSN